MATQTRVKVREYREVLRKAIEAHPNGALKEAGLRHINSWEEWHNLSDELMTYGPWKMIFFLPYFLYLNAKTGKAYSKMMEHQKDFELVSAACGLKEKADYNLKTFERNGNSPISSVEVPTEH